VAQTKTGTRYSCAWWGKSRVLFRPEPKRNKPHPRALRSVCGRRRFGLLLLSRIPRCQLASTSSYVKKSME